MECLKQKKQTNLINLQQNARLQILALQKRYSFIFCIIVQKKTNDDKNELKEENNQDKMKEVEET